MLPESFWKPNEHGVCGGVETAFLSTTNERNVAVEYARSKGGVAVLFEFQMGMIDRGADLTWLSQYPHGATPHLSQP